MNKLENRSPIGTTWWYNYNFSYNAYNEKIKSKQNATTNNCGEKSKFQERAGGKYTKTRITGRNEKQPERLVTDYKEDKKRYDTSLNAIVSGNAINLSPKSTRLRVIFTLTTTR
ncbi:hypothetical protein GN958_ATG06757 [Phytophthora infestans]|uniref:Uncharacterized protein n=1 Tax=Phytophthora infestans TaxID=4787 RepID=A0A8S9USV8_PHYIN|nr:hypothetical protein GN958_ATG06757 [Phytophthora infestans]